MSNYATKTDLKDVTGVDTSKFAKNVDLASLKPNVNQLDVDKLKNVPSAKINKIKGEIPRITNLDTNTALTAVGNKTPDVSNLVKKADYNSKINEIEQKIIDHDH